MFVCGPTVYDYAHIGNFRSFVFFDVVAKYLRQRGYEIDYIQNITDIDDKIIRQARENNRNPLDWAREYTEKFLEDAKALGIDSPKYAPATKYIDEVIKQVKILIDKGFAYEIESDGWYYDLSTFPEYGKLSGRTTQMADDGISRIDENEKKKNRGDFCLWKYSKENEPSWDSELGKGRPGWHIEDTAITEKFFGPQYDIHGGGQDLMFPHHEAEITQQESASGLKPFVKYWMHVAFIIIGKGEKMSKSLGNFETVHNLLTKYHKETLRFYILGGHYRKPLDFSDKNINQAMAGTQRLNELILRLSHTDGISNPDMEQIISDTKKSFIIAMDDDFNTPDALAVIFEFVRKINSSLAENELSKAQAKEISVLLSEFNEVLGIIPTEQQKIPANIQELVEKREKFRKEKKYPESDKLRTEIEELGYILEDTIYGPMIQAK